MSQEKKFFKSLAKQHLFFEVNGKSMCLAPGQTAEFEETDQLKTFLAQNKVAVVEPPKKDEAKAIEANANENAGELVDLSTITGFDALLKQAKLEGVNVEGLKSKAEVREAIEMHRCEKFAELHEENLASFVAINNIQKPANAKEFQAIIDRFKAEVLDKEVE